MLSKKELRSRANSDSCFRSGYETLGLTVPTSMLLRADELIEWCSLLRRKSRRVRSWRKPTPHSKAHPLVNRLNFA
jgi:hypothetical protein